MRHGRHFTLLHMPKVTKIQFRAPSSNPVFSTLKVFEASCRGEVFREASKKE